MAGWVLGIDGGQSRTVAAVCDLQGRLVGVGRAGPADHVWEPGGRGRARRAVVDSMARALRAARLGLAAGQRRVEFEAAFLGITGATEHTRRAVKGCVSTKRFRLANDKVSALACVTEGGPGVVVIAGTGTIAYGENGKGESADASGWGYLIGDEGGAFWIAKQALAAACRAYDGRGEATALVEMITAAAGVKNLWGVHALIYSGKLSRAKMAGLAVVAAEAAAGGDWAARAILREAGRELGLAAGVVAKRLDLHRGKVTVGMVGGVFEGSALVRQSFAREVRNHAAKATLARARYAPVMGSVVLALKMAGCAITAKVRANLEAGSAAVGAK